MGKFRGPIRQSIPQISGIFSPLYIVVIVNAFLILSGKAHLVYGTAPNGAIYSWNYVTKYTGNSLLPEGNKKFFQFIICFDAFVDRNIVQCFVVLQVKWSVYLSYCRALGLSIFLIILLLFGLFEATSVVSNLWLTNWTEDKTMQNSSLANSSSFAHKRDLYLGVYGGFGILQGKHNDASMKWCNNRRRCCQVDVYAK